MSLRPVGTHQIAGLTATANTLYKGLIPPRQGVKTRIMSVTFRCGSTAHTPVFMKALGSTTLASAMADNATTAVLTADPGTGTASGNIATNDYICIQLDNGFFFLSIVTMSSLTATVDAIGSGYTAAAGNKVWTFGAPGDHPAMTVAIASKRLVTPLTGFTLTATASVVNTWGDNTSGLIGSVNTYEPLMIYVANATAASIVELASCAYTLN